MEEVGDCEDDVILTAAVLKRLGFDVALLYYPGHCALGVVGARGLPGTYVVHEGKEYFYGKQRRRVGSWARCQSHFEDGNRTKLRK